MSINLFVNLHQQSAIKSSQVLIELKGTGENIFFFFFFTGIATSRDFFFLFLYDKRNKWISSQF